MDQNILYRQLLRDIRQNHNPSLSIPSASLSLSAFPPDYDQNGNREGEVLRQKNITAHEVSKLSIWLGSVRMMPPPVWIYPSDSNSTEIELPGAMVFLNESEQPIDYFEAFRATSPSRQSGFQISVIGTGIVRPLGNQLNLLAIPDGLAMYFNSSFSALGRMIDLGIYDLDGAELSGLMRVCNVTEKYLYPVMRRISITLAGALGAFGPIFAVLIAAAKQLDSLRKKKSPASLPESNTESGNQSTPNVIEDEEAFLPKETT